MHTSGEPTRIVVNGYPELEGGTLLEKRRCARDKWDEIRMRLMREPRGHAEMYGAILVQETELTRSGEADIGVLFCHNEGYSTMCGHASIGLGRFLVDTHDLNVFPRRNGLVQDPSTGFVTLRLHAPCGIVQLSVPVKPDGHSDPTRPVSFLGVPSFATARNLVVEIPADKLWPSLKATGRSTVTLDVAYGGAFYALVSASELGFPYGLRGATTVTELDHATATLKALLSPRTELFVHPTEADLTFLYGVIVTEVTAQQRETGICFFADQQIDRSPCGSGVMARVALGVAQGRLRLGDTCEYDSVVSLLHGESGYGFRGTAVEEREEGVIVKVDGRAFYTGASSFVVEEHDALPNGFIVGLPA
ncbi:proline racemase [Roridomyces roridus]|uniref:trans-L-3-hydroxyproline dehydratase n=1 Tax=Roridomyces roridus TaxID=1738132 RepID=A0AAD7B9P1_9AGAR|nr:proline racemase [Roridomyces roridus]